MPLLSLVSGILFSFIFLLQEGQCVLERVSLFELYHDFRSLNFDDVFVLIVDKLDPFDFSYFVTSYLVQS